ncbi:MAG: hypothetical protein IKH57_17110 [Clostridia bacterium]|nr:hypothetical protein [Clostridia bacterium]
MKATKKKRIRNIVFLVIVMIMVFPLQTNAYFPSYGQYLGTDYVYKAGGTVDTEMRAYVYYHSNDTSQIDLHSLCQWVKNNGTAYVNQCEYLVHTPSFSKYSTYTDYITPITQNNYRRMEIDWETVEYLNHSNYNTSYSKEGNYVFIELIAANAALGGGEWQSFWWAASPGTTFSAQLYQ